MLHTIKLRIFSAVLCVAMLLTSMPLNMFAYEGEENEVTEIPEYLVNPGAKIGNIATFNLEDWANFHICDNPVEYDDAWLDDESYWLNNDYEGVDDLTDDDMQLVITNYYYDAEMDYLWYAVKAAPGYELPDKMVDKPYVLWQDGWGNPDALYITDSGKNFIFDAEENPVSDAVLPFYETVILQGASTLQGKVEYQWQILADDLWVDIAGEDEAKININIGMLSNVLVGDTAYVRCVSTSGSKSVVGEVIPITVEAYEPQDMMMLMMADSASSDGIATVADEPTYFYVTVKYVFQNGDEAENPFIAQILQNGELNTTVSFPTVQGYLPYYNGVQQDTMDISIDKVTENIVYTVTYLPASVEYKVAVYFQNVDDDNYTFQSVETLTGLTGSKVPQNTVTYEGMYELLHETPEIAANGSTLIEVYFNRIYYLTRFELDGGFGVYSIYARYGSELAGNVGTPIKPGYSFVGWDDVTGGTGDGIADDIPDTVQDEERVYKAIWKQNATAKVRIVFWGENPNDEEYAYLESKELYVKPGTVLTFNSGTFVCGLEEHTHSTACETTCGKTAEVHTDSCYGNCTVKGHQHTKTCYDNVGDKVNNTPNGAPNNPKDGQIYRRYAYSGDRYIYISGSWYEYDGNQNSGTIIQPNPSCELNSHTHTIACLSCNHHTHTADCYKCIQHRHSDICSLKYTIDTSKWTLVKSDQITVAADGSSVMNVYYDRTTFTMTFKKEGSNGATIATIIDKWGADIRMRFNDISKANTFFWSKKQNGGSPWTSFMDVMPSENTIFYADPQSGNSTLTATYYGQKLDGSGYEAIYPISFKGSSTITVSEEEFVKIEGFVFNESKSSKTGDRYNGAAFYYDREAFRLEFHSGTILDREEYVKYEELFDKFIGYEPALPPEYETGSREFKGWYLNPECTGNPVDLTTMTMPAKNVALYAKWELVSHDVNIYKEKLDDGTFGEPVLPDGKQPEPVIHGGVVFPSGYEIPIPENKPYTFIGWFYMEGDDERMWDFEHSVVVRDTDIYAKWSSEVLVPYTIRFVTDNGDGTFTEIAAPVSSSSLAGTTVTFHAKGGGDLYEAYRKGYFPTTTSHSLTMDINKSEEGMTYDFVYVKKDAVPYTVYYRDEQGNNLITPKVVNDNVYAIVTEKFEYIPGYVPDEYQKTLVIDADSENEIVFVYTESHTQGVYNVTHYIRDAEGEEYIIHSTYGDIGQINDEIKIPPLTLTGFTYDYALVNNVKTNLVDGTVNGFIKAEGLEIKLYYERNKYPYKVQYLDKDTLKVLKDPVINSEGAYYGTMETETNPPIIENYQLSDVVSCYIVVDDAINPVKNIITVYYTEKTVEIKYVVVGPDGCGKVNPEVTKVKALTGTGASSTATANEKYVFAGWYRDEECEEELITKDVTLNLLKPKDGPWVAVTYYAKFIPAVGDLTITRTDAAESDQVFVYEVTHTVSGETIYVTIVGNGAVTIHDIPIGDYVVTQQNDWSWRYGDAAQEVPVECAQEAEVTFNEASTIMKWLNGNSNLILNRRAAE